MPCGWIDPLHFIDLTCRNPGLDEHRLTQDFQFKRNTQTSYLAGALFFLEGNRNRIMKYISIFIHPENPKVLFVGHGLAVGPWGKDVKNQHSENVQTLDLDGVGGARTCGFLPVMLVFESQDRTENMAHGFCIDVACMCQHVKKHAPISMNTH